MTHPDVDRFLAGVIEKLPEVVTALDPPDDPDGPLFIDLASRGNEAIVEWRPGQGFGVSKPSDGYGEGPDEVFTDVEGAVSRTLELLS